MAVFKSYIPIHEQAKQDIGGGMKDINTNEVITKDDLVEGYTPQYTPPVEVVTKKRNVEGIPKRYQHIDIANTLGFFQKNNIVNVMAIEKCMKYINHMDEYIQDGIGLLIRGSVGTGKTSMAVSVMREAIKHNYSVLFVPSSSLVDMIMSGSEEERVKFNNRLKHVKLLVIDDLGTEYSKGWITNKIQSIIDERYNEKKTTIITTNLEQKGSLRNRYSARLEDRILETSIVINCVGKSVRKQFDMEN